MTQPLDVFALSGDLPPQWAKLPDELLAHLRPVNGVYSPAQRAALNRIAAGRFFLIRNEPIHGAGRTPCGRCGRRHKYVTIRCVECPFNGLREAWTWLSTSELGLGISGVIQPGTLEPIAAAEAARHEQRIRDRGGRPIGQQAPSRLVDVNGDAYQQWLVREAVSLRPQRR